MAVVVVYWPNIDADNELDNKVLGCTLKRQLTLSGPSARLLFIRQSVKCDTYVSSYLLLVAMSVS